MTITITFDNPTAEYYAGQSVSGTVNVQLGERKKIKRIAVDFEGVAYCSWTETHEEKKNDKTETVTVEYNGNRKLFEYRLVLAEGPGEFELQPGRHTYRFEYTLPPHIPADMEGEFGYVRYVAKGRVDVPWAFDLSCSVPIKVIPHVDLNTLMQAKQRLLMEKQKSVGLFCCSSGNINFTLTAPKSGYTCQETIPFEIQIENHSGSDIYETSIEIRKNVEYIANYPSTDTRRENFVLIEGKWPTVVPPNSQQFSLHAPLHLLPSQPTTLDDNAIIKISYAAAVACKIRGMHTNITGKLPVIIGTIPIGDSQVHVGDSFGPSAPQPGGAIGWVNA